MLLTEALQIPPSARCICAVGAGGKTSLLYELAEDYRQEGKRVLLTTTTKMYLPEKDGVLDGTAKEIKEKLERDGFAVAGSIFSEERLVQICCEGAGCYQQLGICSGNRSGDNRCKQKSTDACREESSRHSNEYKFLISLSEQFSAHNHSA